MKYPHVLALRTAASQWRRYSVLLLATPSKSHLQIPHSLDPCLLCVVACAKRQHHVCPRNPMVASCRPTARGRRVGESEPAVRQCCQAVLATRAGCSQRRGTVWRLPSQNRLDRSRRGKAGILRGCRSEGRNRKQMFIARNTCLVVLCPSKRGSVRAPHPKQIALQFKAAGDRGESSHRSAQAVPIAHLAALQPAALLPAPPPRATTSSRHSEILSVASPHPQLAEARARAEGGEAGAEQDRVR